MRRYGYKNIFCAHKHYSEYYTKHKAWKKAIKLHVKRTEYQSCNYCRNNRAFFGNYLLKCCPKKELL